MAALLDLIFAVLNLAATKVQSGLKSEVKAIQCGIMHLLVAAMILAASLLFFLAGMAMVLFGLYLVLEPGAGRAGAAFISGAIALLVGGILVGFARQASH